MTKEAIEGQLDRFAADLLRPVGFVRQMRLLYTKIMNEGIAVVAFPFRMDARGFGAFTCSAGVRFECLAKWLEDGQAVSKTTVGQPINMLREDKGYVEWRFSTMDGLYGMKTDIWSDINKYIIPFIETNSRMTDVYRVLNSEHPKDSFMLGIDIFRRPLLLSAFELHWGRKTEAIRILEDALAGNRKRQPYKFELSSLLRRAQQLP